jgi:threonine synthase
MCSANSINLARLIPQAFYHVYGFSRQDRKPSEQVLICVPSGNFGNLTAGVYAWQWGLPVAGFIAATNINAVVPEYLATGIFQPRPSLKTLSNAMDVGNPSNFERLRAVFNNKVEHMREWIEGVRVTDAETRETIRQIYEESGLLIDPHTAVGVLASRRYRQRSGFSGHILTLATAHPGKFADVIQEVTGASPELPTTLREALSKQKHSILREPHLEDFKALLLQRYG